MVKFVSGRRSVSAACGDFPMEKRAVAEKVLEIAATGVDFIKIGFFPSEQAIACADALSDIARSKKLIAVLFADHRYEGGMLAALGEIGFHGVMVDTDDKAKGRLLHHLPPDRIAAFVEDAHRHGMMVGLAGSLEAPDIPRLLPYGPDFIGFRGALCGGQSRSSEIDAESVAKIRALIPQEQPPEAVSRVDYQLLAARGYFPDPADAGLGTDQIFVRDFVLPVEIGAYSFEHGKTQKVRFDVTADVLRVTRNPEDMRHVVSYDLIMDGIRSIVGRGHVELVETLVEQIAALVLESPRVTRVVVRAEKLELGPGGVGVQIERTQESIRASKPSPAHTEGSRGGRGAA
ncbi:(5-formylfuran-3-yl)methyl phosphate synthase [Sinorhizobium sp. BG8]|uniref:(5-formylfuran-3-yl)methyl phosphate synthase n=1 Tax=Sinorhizobium sp. BG8 TaxID=2613773 RepID=UPI001FED6805|nr:(5-formylfuran-3-yl)methyl phosphate synthase [Sinorhizobium sp. BG8]